MADFSTETEKDVWEWAKKAANILFTSGLIIDFYHTKFSALGGATELKQLRAAAEDLGILTEAI